jgi:serine/threonine protein kinase
VAPEVLKMEYSQKADLWSAGILAYQLLTGRLPFIGETGLLVSKLYMAKQVFTNKVSVGSCVIACFMAVITVDVGVHAFCCHKVFQTWRSVV